MLLYIKFVRNQIHASVETKYVRFRFYSSGIWIGFTYGLNTVRTRVKAEFLGQFFNQEMSGWGVKLSSKMQQNLDILFCF